MEERERDKIVSKGRGRTLGRKSPREVKGELERQ